MTPAEFKVRKPQFVAIADVTVQTYLDMAALAVDTSWIASNIDPALAAFTCHLMTIDGLGTGPEATEYATGTAAFQSIKSGNLSLTRYARAGGAGEGARYVDWLRTTKCGQYYSMLLRANKGGPRTVGVGGLPAMSGYAKDWPGWFDLSS